MNRTIVSRLELIIQNRIAAKKESKKEYDFMQIKREVLHEFRGDFDASERVEYSSELSKRFGQEGGKKAAKNKKERKKLEELEKKRKAIAAEAKLQLQIADATKLELAEKVRSGNLELSPEGDVFRLEDDEEK